MSTTRTLLVSSRDDLCYLEALVDTAPRLTSIGDLSAAPLTDEWKAVIKALVTVAKDHSVCMGASPT